MADYLASLESYFRVNPYFGWFDSYEQALSGLNALYCGQKPSVALHTDVGSVLATKPTWHRLNRQDRERIANSGVQLWHRLIEHLKPEILLWSTARSWLDRIEFHPTGCWDDLYVFRETKSGAPRKLPTAVRRRWYQLRTGEKLLVAFIPAAQKPLGRLSHCHKRAAGEAILDAWKASVDRT